MQAHRAGIREQVVGQPRRAFGNGEAFPDSASLHPGYDWSDLGGSLPNPMKSR
jgi:hypothetical protein